MKKEATEESASVITFYDAEKLQMILMYAKVRGVDVNKAMVDTLDKLYARCVPPSVQDYLDMKQGRGKQNSENGGGE